MKAVRALFIVLFNVAVAAPLAASPRAPAAAWPGVSDVLLNVTVAAPAAASPRVAVAAWPWDSEQPGSYLVFPKFNKGTVTTANQGKLPRSEFEIRDRKSTRLNSSHANISYAVFCLKK